MRTQRLLQPFRDTRRVGAALAERSSDATSLWILTAWAQESGLKHLRPLVDAIRARQGHAEAILGVDQGIATLEGLRQALQLFDAVYLFHDGERTFHPKLYVIENDRSARLVIGSSNVTEGGFYTNFEASVAIDLNRRTRSDNRLRKEARQYYESFIASGMPFRQLDAPLSDRHRNINSCRAGGGTDGEGTQGVLRTGAPRVVGALAARGVGQRDRPGARSSARHRSLHDPPTRWCAAA